jgi:ubiquitin carboxyl-terminal hydrolase 5/13
VKSTAELEVELNATYAFDAITEAGTELQPLSGPGLQGLQNLGNSCYMNSIFQLLFSGTIPELVRRYGCRATPNPAAVNDEDDDDDEVITNHPLLKNVAPAAAPLDVLCQTTKLACALTSGIFAKPTIVETDMTQAAATTDPKYRLAPRMIKHCIGKDHVEFRTAQQQDAAQFLQYYIERLDRAELGVTSNPMKEHLLNHHDTSTENASLLRTTSHLFSFRSTERRICVADNKVSYKVGAPETIWSLRIPMEQAKFDVTSEDVVLSPEQKRLKSDDGTEMTTSDDNGTEKKSVPTIPLLSCIEEWANDSTVENIRWAHLNNATHSAQQNVRLTNFPRYLILQMNRYELGPDWSPVKLEVNLLVPEEIDLTKYKSLGPQDSEVLIPDDSNNNHELKASAESPNVQASAPIDEVALSQLMDMGFSLNSCKRALSAVGGMNVDAAMGWVFEHNVSLTCVQVALWMYSSH